MPQLPVVRTFMDTDTHALHVDDPILDAVRRLIDEGVTGAPVVDDAGELVGLLSEYDCLKLLAGGAAHDLPTGRVRDYTDTGFPSVTPQMDVYFVAGMFLANPGTRRFAVCEGHRLVGVVTRKDILRAVGAGLRDVSA